MHKSLKQLEASFCFEPDCELASISFQTPQCEDPPVKPNVDCFIELEQSEYGKYADFLAGRATEVELTAKVTLKCDATFSQKRRADIYPFPSQGLARTYIYGQGDK